jgi:hypothetical protein
VVVAGALAVVVVTAGVAQHEVSQWRTERRLNDTVGIRAAIDVSSSSTTPRGGRVDFSMTIRNDGPRRVRVTGVSIAQDGLRVAAPGLGTGTFVRAGSAKDVSLSVRLDCNQRRSGAIVPGLRGVVNVRPLSGSLHRVSLTFGRATSLIDVAETLCSIGPHDFGELSGPILHSNTG